MYPFRWSSFPGLIVEGQFRSSAGPVREEVVMVLHRIAVVSAFAVSATAVLAKGETYRTPTRSSNAAIAAAA